MYTQFVFAAINLEGYFAELAEKSWVILPFETEMALQLLQASQSKSAHFRPAGINHSQMGQQQLESVRSDQIYWLDSKQTDLSSTEKKLLTGLTSLQAQLQNYFRIRLNEYECHYAVYQPGQRYQRHRDTLKANNKRIFSFVIYLNPDWTAADGGQIIGYNKNEVLFKIEPLAGQMLLFKSDIEHEVAESIRTRFSLTGWLRQ